MDNLINGLVLQGLDWVTTQRQRYHDRGNQITDDYILVLQQFFDEKLLSSMRIFKVHQIDNPPFYNIIRNAVPFELIDFQEMAGITFVDTILIAPDKVNHKKWLPLLFHECVHAVQYQLLGTEIFVEDYVRSWAAMGFQYNAIPLEREAYMLQSRFEKDMNIHFSAANEVRDLLRERGLVN